MDSVLKVGRIGYLNVLPIYYPLEQGAVRHSFSFVYGSPAELNGLMAHGDLDVSVVSSVEYARHFTRYLILPNLSISCRGEVKSVLLFSKFPLEKLNNRVVHMTPQSHTSVTLLKILLTKAYGIKCSFISMVRPLWQSTIKDLPDAYLTIGDEALYWKKRQIFPHVWDLGKLWYKWTGLPFVFALWVCRKDLEGFGRDRLVRCIESFLEAKSWGLRNLEIVCSQASQTTFMTCDELRIYLSCLSYDLEEDMFSGLKYYYKLLHQEGIIHSEPPLVFARTEPSEMISTYKSR
ncbi:MAG: menaquinone biosynthesis protein [Syntrophobacterales bacterium]|nr:menaquinone biosynthesis protein [Syntrophobacterales bacterium]